MKTDMGLKERQGYRKPKLPGKVRRTLGKWRSSGYIALDTLLEDCESESFRHRDLSDPKAEEPLLDARSLPYYDGS